MATMAAIATLKDAEFTFEDGEHPARPYLSRLCELRFQLFDFQILGSGCGRARFLNDSVHVAHKGVDFACVGILNVLVLFTGQRITWPFYR